MSNIVCKLKLKALIKSVINKVYNKIFDYGKKNRKFEENHHNLIRFMQTKKYNIKILVLLASFVKFCASRKLYKFINLNSESVNQIFFYCNDIFKLSRKFKPDRNLELINY